MKLELAIVSFMCDILLFTIYIYFEVCIQTIWRTLYNIDIDK